MNLHPEPMLSLPLIAFMAAQSITPGPNNLLLATAGATAGFRATLPHMLGISCGCGIQIIVLAAGLAPLLTAFPAWRPIFTVLAAAYLLWLSWKLATAAAPTGATGGAGRPMSFLGAAAFQWINPKAWLMSLTVATAFWPLDKPFAEAALLTAGLATLVNLPCISVWAATGAALQGWLRVGRRWTRFNQTMALALLGTVPALF